MTSDSQRLLARGRTVTLVDGSAATVRFSMRALVEIEDAFGSLTGMETALTGSIDPQGNVTGKIIRPICQIFAAAIEGLDYEAILDQLDPARLDEYVSAVFDALGEALPQSSEVNRGNGRAPTNGATGPASTTSPPSATAAATTSGGA